MFWKSAKFVVKGLISRLLPRSWSIASRLTMLYSLSTVTLLAMVSLPMYWILTANFDQQDYEFLADKIHILRTMLRERPDNIDGLREEIVWESAARRFEKYYGRILDENGTILLETPRLNQILSVDSFPRPFEIDARPRRTRRRTGEDGNSYVAMAAWAAVGNSATERRLCQVALETAQEHRVLFDYRRKMLILLLFGAVFSAISGIFIAREGLRPIQEIEGLTRRISATHLHERLGEKGWPREIGQLATAFEAMLKRLEDSFTRLSQFASDLAHEFRTPINNLRGEAEVALSRSRSVEEYQLVLESSLEEFTRLSRVIDGLLFMARAEVSAAPIKKVAVKAHYEIRAVIEFFEALASEQEITIRSSGEATILADPELFRRAVSNLLSNALRYTERGGRVDITVTRSKRNFVEVQVSDNGIGMSPEIQARIFDRFFRGETGRTKYPGGTGLGLSIVKSIMDLHNGSIVVHSMPQQGTTMTLRFPLS